MAAFTTRRFDWRVLVAAGVVAPLAMMLALQYWALSRLQDTSPAAARIELAARARDLAVDMQRQLEADARMRLEVAPGSIPTDFCYDDVTTLFARAPKDGVQAYFLGGPAENGKAQVILYDVKRGAVCEERSTAMLAAFGAFLPAMRHIVKGEVVDPGALTVWESDPENRVILKPVVDEGGRMVAAAGMILDSRDYTARFLPTAVPGVVTRYFGSDQACNIAITVRDAGGSAVYSNGGGGDGADEVRERIPFAFTDWTIGVRFREGSYEQWARRLFLLNMSLSVVMTLAVLAAVGFAFRLAAREVRLSRMKSEFVSNVSHELRTPLASIRVLGEFLKLGWYRGDATVQEYGQYIEAESTRLTRLIDNILDFSRIESGRREYRFELGDVGAIVRGAVETFAPRARALGFEVELEEPRVAIPAASVDADQLSHALLNLLDNAVKYSGESRTVRVSTAAEGGSIVVSVRDFGIGIDPAEREKIFERFYRVSTGLVHDVKGSGLGLSIVKHIADAHGGRVRVESEPGEGSTFSLVVPAAESAAPAAEVAVAGAC